MRGAGDSIDKRPRFRGTVLRGGVKLVKLLLMALKV